MIWNSFVHAEQLLPEYENNAATCLLLENISILIPIMLNDFDVLWMHLLSIYSLDLPALLTLFLWMPYLVSSLITHLPVYTIIFVQNSIHVWDTDLEKRLAHKYGTKSQGCLVQRDTFIWQSKIVEFVQFKKWIAHLINDFAYNIALLQTSYFFHIIQYLVKLYLKKHNFSYL